MEVESGVQRPQDVEGGKMIEKREQEQGEELRQELAQSLGGQAAAECRVEHQNEAPEKKAKQGTASGLNQGLQSGREIIEEGKKRKESGPDGIQSSTKKQKQYETDCELEVAQSQADKSAMADIPVDESICEPGLALSNSEAIERQPLGESCSDGFASADLPSTSTKTELENDLQGPNQLQLPPSQAAPIERPPLTMADVQGLLSDYRSSLKPRKKKVKEAPPPPVPSAPQPVINYWPSGLPPYVPFRPMQPLPAPLPKLNHQPPQFVPAPFNGYYRPPGQGAPPPPPPPLGYFPIHPPMPAATVPPPQRQEGQHSTAISNHRLVKMLTCRCKRSANGGAERPEGVEGVTEADTPSESSCTCDVHKLCKEIGPLPIREDVGKALAGYKHDGSVHGRKEEAVRHFLSEVIQQVLGHNVLLLRNLTSMAEAANTNSGCGTEKGASMSARPEGVYNLVCNCLQLKPATSSERALGTILLPTHCVSASPFIFKLMKELQRSKRSKSKK